MDLSKLLEAGPTAMLSAALFLVALGGYNFLKSRRWKESGEDRRAAINIDCPNKVPGLKAAVEGMTRALEYHTEQASSHAEDTKSYAPIAQRIDSGVDRLLEQVRPGSRTTQVREESRDMLVKLVGFSEGQHDLMKELVHLVKNGSGKT